MKTSIGGVITICILIMTLAYTGTKAIELRERAHPIIVQNTRKGEIGADVTVKVNEIGFRMAFSLENYLTRDTVDDPRYIKWLVRMYGRNNGEWYEEILPYHKCTPEDYSEFSPLDNLSHKIFDAVNKNEKRDFYCLDEWPENMMLGGEQEADTYRRLEVIFTPCNYIHSHLGYQGDFVREDCIADFEAQQAYTGPLDVRLMVSDEKMDPFGFGTASSTERRTKIINQ